MSETQKQSDKDHRQQITVQQVEEIFGSIRQQLFHRFNEKGYGTWLSQHEILGVITEEYHYLTKGIEPNLLGKMRMRSKLADIAVGCIFGIACIDAETLDW